MDNAAFHKKEVLYQIAKKYSQELIFLPPYSPEYNPIEHTWSALKRKVAGCVHLYSSVSQALDAVLKGIVKVTAYRAVRSSFFIEKLAGW